MEKQRASTQELYDTLAQLKRIIHDLEKNAREMKVRLEFEILNNNFSNQKNILQQMLAHQREIKNTKKMSLQNSQDARKAAKINADQESTGGYIIPTR